MPLPRMPVKTPTALRSGLRLTARATSAESELVVVGISSPGFLPVAGLPEHPSPFGIDWGVDEALGEIVDELVEVHVVLERNVKQTRIRPHRWGFRDLFLY